MIYDISANTIANQVKKVLLSKHSMSGSVSSFYGLGKVFFLKVLTSEHRFLEALLGKDLFVSSVVKEVLEEFICKLYGFGNETKIKYLI